VRNLQNGHDAKTQIEKSIQQKKGKVDVWELDMGSYPSIQAFAERAEELERLDVVVLNAGVYIVDYKKSRYGWEETLQINAISTALLGILLLPNSAPRSSQPHSASGVCIEHQLPKNYTRCPWSWEREGAGADS